MWLQHLRCQLWIRTPPHLEVFLILKRPCVWGVFWAVQIKQLGCPNAWHAVGALRRAQWLFLWPGRYLCEPSLLSWLGGTCMWLQLNAAGAQPLKPCKVQVTHQSQNKNYFGFFFFHFVLLTLLDFASKFLYHTRHLLWQHLSPLQLSSLWALTVELCPWAEPLELLCLPPTCPGQFGQLLTLLRVCHHGSSDVVPCLWRSLTYFGAGIQSLHSSSPLSPAVVYVGPPTPLIRGVAAARLEYASLRSKHHAKIPYSVYLAEIK